ncbi:MAG: division/cell wall cluster transcriptional repressor MraZ [Chloroflexaceae bacterium]|nr:division/cell wall cluster transcriptional repressor MraZ [Chloroflexaceae bacterium]
MFIGEYEHSIDEKGRVAIPARFREHLTEGFYITVGFETCLQAFPMPVFTEVSAKVRQVSMATEQGRLMRRMFFSKAADADVDRQGRVLIPHNLREEAGIGERVVFAGMETYFEIWSAEEWERMQVKLKEGRGLMSETTVMLNI